MTYTTVPTIIITLILFFLIGINSENESVSVNEMDLFLNTISSHFYIGLELFILPIIIAILIYNRMGAIKTLSIGVISGLVFAYIFQQELINQINIETQQNTIETLLKTTFFGTEIYTENTNINNLLMKDGALGMFWIVLLVLSAMIFGGVMYAGGFLKKITIK